jgi:four helix bundle protein
MNAKTTNANRARLTPLAHGLGLGLEQRPLPHERLDVFRVAIELVEHIAKLQVRRGASNAYDQLKRASSSVALNIAEACGKQDKDRRRFFEIARGSGLESAAALRILWAMGAINQAQHDTGRSLCERLYAMLTKLCRAG